MGNIKEPQLKLGLFIRGGEKEVTFLHI